MKNLYLFLILLLLANFNLTSQESTANWREMHYLSEEEMLLPLNVDDFYETDPPVGDIKNVAEFDQMQAVIVRYPFGIPMSLVKELADDIEVLTLVRNASEEQVVTLAYTDNNVNLDNCSFLYVPTDSYWTRDYGPWFIFDGNKQPGIVNFPYNRPRPNDDDIPIKIATYLDIDLYGMNLISTGGNYMTDGLGKSASTELVYEENPTLDKEDIDLLVSDYLNVDNYYLIDDPLGDYIKHIDCWGKFLSPGKVLIGQVPETDDRYDDFEAAANFFKTTISSWGKPYEVFRVYTPGSPQPTPYTNSLIANKKVFVPLTGNQWDDEAIDAYEEAMPGYEVVGITYNGWLNTDALHCRAKGIADLGMLYIEHMPILGTVGAKESYEVTAKFIAYSGEDVYADSALIYYSINGGTYQTAGMEWVSDDTWTGEITGADAGDHVSYYIYAADESGRNAKHPYIGEPDPHEFTVFGIQVDELVFDPDTVAFTTFDETWEGKTLHIINVKSDSVEITYITPGWPESGEFAWYVEEMPELPLKLGSNDTIDLLIKVDWIVKNTNGILVDSLFVTTTKDTYHAIITINDDIVGIGEIDKEAEFKVFPNPFTDQLNVSFWLNENQKVKLSVFDINGLLISEQEKAFSAGSQTMVWKASQNVKAGYYFYKLQLGKRIESGKVILNR